MKRHYFPFPGWDAWPPQVTPSIFSMMPRQVTGAIYIPGWRGTCLAQEHNTVTPVRARTHTSWSRVKLLNITICASLMMYTSLFCVTPSGWWWSCNGLLFVTKVLTTRREFVITYIRQPFTFISPSRTVSFPSFVSLVISIGPEKSHYIGGVIFVCSQGQMKVVFSSTDSSSYAVNRKICVKFVNRCWSVVVSFHWDVTKILFQ